MKLAEIAGRIEEDDVRDAFAGALQLLCDAEGELPSPRVTEEDMGAARRRLANEADVALQARLLLEEGEAVEREREHRRQPLIHEAIAGSRREREERRAGGGVVEQDERIVEQAAIDA